MAPKRIQRSRAKGWRMPVNSVCVTRPGVFGNPFNTAEAFEAWIRKGEIALSDLRDQSWFPWTPESKRRLAARRDRVIERLPDLRGKDLACFCSPETRCHGDVLLELANQ